MKQQFTENEKAFFKRLRGNKSRLKVIFIGISFLLFIGLLLDAFSGFYIVKHSKTIYGGIAGLFLISLFYLFVEAGAGWINSKDNVSHPWYKRAFHLFILICFVGVVMAVCWYMFNKLGW